MRISTLGTQVEMLQQSKNGFINILYPPGKTVRSGCDGVNDAVTKVTTTCNCNLSSSPPHTHTPHTHHTTLISTADVRQIAQVLSVKTISAAGRRGGDGGGGGGDGGSDGGGGVIIIGSE